MTTISKTQDLPPPGGYKPITFHRIPAKQYFNGYTMMAAYLGMTAGAAFIYFLNYKMNHMQEIEQRSAALAILPLLIAERDREMLKQMRKNRDEEAKLMANVEGWKVGTYYGEPIYHTKEKDSFVMPQIYEYFAHSSNKDFSKRATFSFWT